MKTKTLTKYKSQVLMALLTIVTLMAGQSAWAQDIDYTATVGTGSSTYHLIPIATNYKYSLTQQIYTAEDIMRAGTIQTISFYASRAFAKNLGTIKVYLKQVGKSSFANASDVVAIGDGDKVFEGTFMPIAEGWTTITLDTPFAYDGYSNLLVCLYDETEGEWHTNNDRKFRYSTTSDKMAISWHSDSSAPDLNNLGSFNEKNSKDIYNYRSIIQIGFSNSSTVNILPRPSDLNSYIVPGDGTSAVVGWIENGSATAWQICLNEDTGHPIDASINPYTITGLTADAACSVRVRAVSGGNHSSWSDAFSFTPTAVSDYTLTVNKSTGTREDAPVYGIGMDEGNSLCQFIIPASTLSLMSNSTLEKMTFYSGSGASYQNVSWGDARFKVYLSEVNATTFSSTLFYDWEPLDEVYLGSLSVVNGKMEIMFDTPYQYHGGNLLVGVRQIAAGTNASCFWKVKTVGNNTVNSHYSLQQSQPETTFQYTPGFSGSYPKPSDVSVSYTEGTTADVNWTSSASAWQIRLNDDKANLISVPTKPFTLTGLDYITEYHVQVRANYGSGHYSHWSPTTTFSTIGACPEPTALEGSLTPGCGTIATLSWTENGTATTWQVCLNGDTEHLIDVSTNPYTLTGLTPDVATTVMIRAFNGGPSYWSNTISITPRSISSLAVNYTGGTSAEISWISNDVTAWDISVNSTVHENINDNPYTLTGLLSGTTYNIKVRTRNGNDVGAWSDIISFKAYEIQNVNYIDVDGSEQSVTAAVLSGSETTLDEGWYVVKTDVLFDHRINVHNAHARIILADGATMQIGTSGMPLNTECIGYTGSNVDSQLSIYGQSGDTGSLSVYSTSIAIDVPEVNIYGGNIIASGGEYNAGIRSLNCISISGGNVNSTGGVGGIDGVYGITLGWRNASDRIYASSYEYGSNGSLSITSGQYLYTGTEVVSGTIADLTKVNGKTLQPAVKITLGTGITATGTNVFTQADGTYALPGATVTLSASREGYSIVDGSYAVTDAGSTPVTVTESLGEYTFTIPAKNVTITATWRKLLTNTDITIANIPSQEYTGSALTPVVIITDGSTELVENTDYTVTLPEGRINTGDYTITLTGIGDYSGTVEKTFTITPVPVTLTANSRNTDVYDGTEKTVNGYTCNVDGLTFTGVTASGSGTNTGNYAVTFTGVTLNTTTDDTGNYIVTATTNGTLTILPYVLTEETGFTDAIATLIANQDVQFSRTFTANTASTICLPFAMTSISGGKVYEFVGVEYDAIDGWVAAMSDATPGGNNVTTTQANKPYLFMPNATAEVVFNGTASATIPAGTTVSGDWTFHGTYTYLTYDTDPFSGTVFGFAATGGTASDNVTVVTAGQFVKAADGASIKPFRAYLTYSGSNQVFHAPGRDGSSTSDIPDRINVRLLGSDGKITAVGTIDLSTGDVTIERWFDINGRAVEGTPSAPGLYLNDSGKKVMIK